MALNKGTIGKRLRRQREKLSLTREAFAEQVEISPQFLAELENGSKGMSVETLYKICEQTDISADYMLLGRQFTGGAQTPAVEMLCRIPPRYTETIETILRAFLRTIEMAECKDE